MEQKLEKLLGRLKACGSLVIALSGGVDSSTLAKAASVALGDKAVAVTARSELLSADELADAKAMARAAGIRHIIVDVRDLDDPQIVKNDKERCYYCKRGRFQKLVAWARENGFAFVADGGNLDDKNDYRPGMKAIEELAPTVISPFIECGWTKADIRRQAKEWGLSVAEKPSAACLASRVEYGLPLTPERLAQVEKAEHILRAVSKGQLRVRHHGNIARVEVEAEAPSGLAHTGAANSFLSPAAPIPEAFEEVIRHRGEIVEKLKGLGFTYVTLDLGGYRMGSANETL